MLSPSLSIRRRKILYRRRGKDAPKWYGMMWALMVCKEYMRSRRMGYLPEYPKEPDRLSKMFWRD